MKKPNIVFFFSDQQRWDTVGSYGQKLDITPNLDRLAREGVRFEYAFTCQPVCGPARACLQTGTYATQNGCFRNRIGLRPNQRTIAHYLSDAGYQTAYIGKWHLASTRCEGMETVDYETKAVPPAYRGGWKDYWMAADCLEHTSHSEGGFMYDGDMNKVEFGGYRADKQTDFALDFIQSHAKNPFILYISYLEPHHQNDRNRYEGPPGSAEKFKDYDVPPDLQGKEGDWKENYPDYLGCCNSLDYNLGRIRAELERQGILEDTIIIYTSDHGSHFRTRNDEYKRTCHENAIRIPMVIRGGNFRGGTVVRELVSLIDIPPTILSAAGVTPPSYMTGNDMSALISGEETKWKEDVFLQISESQVGRALRTKRYKYCVTAPDKDGWRDKDSDRYVESFLYDLEADPYESANLIGSRDYLGVRKELAALLQKRMGEAGEAVPEIIFHD